MTHSDHILSAAPLFTDGMVLQRHQPIAVFGTAPAGATGTVTLTKPGHTKPKKHKKKSGNPAKAAKVTVPTITATFEADSNSNFLTYLPEQKAAHDCTLTITLDGTNESLTFSNVSIGEVWLVADASGINVINSFLGDEQVAQSAQLGDTVHLFSAEEPGMWKTVSPQTSGSMSALAYYFVSTISLSLSNHYDQLLHDTFLQLGAKEVRHQTGVFLAPEDPAYEDTIYEFLQETGLTDDIHHKAEQQLPQHLPASIIEQFRNVPVGIVDISHSTSVSPTSEPSVSVPSASTPATSPAPLVQLSSLTPLAPFTAAGVLWNTAYPQPDGAPTPEESINDLRSTWNVPRLPVMIVQLPQISNDSETPAAASQTTNEPTENGNVSCETNDPFAVPQLRAAQLAAADNLPNVGIVSTMDCGKLDSTYPVDMTTIGIRAASYALERWYGFAELNGMSADEDDDFIDFSADGMTGDLTAGLADEMAADLHDIDPTNALNVSHSELDGYAAMLTPMTGDEVAEFRGSNAIVNTAGSPRAREAFGTPDGAVLVRFSDAYGLQLVENPIVSSTISETGNGDLLTFSLAERIFDDSLMTAYTSEIDDVTKSGCELQSEDSSWHAACVKIADSSDLDDEAMVRIWVPDAPDFHPTAVRYAWRSQTAAPLFSEYENAAFPFLLSLE